MKAKRKMAKEPLASERIAGNTRRSEKISDMHMERLAMVYVRQSTQQQLIRNQESTQVQYNLKNRAQELGWPEDRVVVIDEDLGKSGTSIEGRSGFQRLVTEVTLDHVGIILGVEMSRLARSCKDWYHLLEVCALFRTLIADQDGVYDPSQYNDRLLLGLKGTMSEAELHIMKQRMHQGKLNKARRGELVYQVPIGYVRRPSGEVALDPDEEAQEVVRLVFMKFNELRTLNAVLRYFVSNGIKLPVRVRSGLRKGELEWRRPSRMTLHNILKNPIYAGVYTYGRRAVDPRRKIPGRPGTGRTVIPPEHCQVFLKDRFPSYITWEDYKINQGQLQANRTVAEEVGTPRQGPSLLAGLVVCGKCGCRMNVRYNGKKTRHTYVCTNRAVVYGEPKCQSLAGPLLDEFVTERVIKALEPASLELSLEAAHDIERKRLEIEALWEKRLERAGYEVERTERQYRLVEPENRLVARQLEKNWEANLEKQRSLEEEHERFIMNKPRLLTADERESIRELAADIPALWGSPHTSDVDRKEILRQVIDRVVIDVLGHSERVDIKVYWSGGTETEHEITKLVSRLEHLSYWPELSKRVRQMATEKLNTGEISEQLNKEGWRPPKGAKKFDSQGVHYLMVRLGLKTKGARSRNNSNLGKDEWWLQTLADRLEMPRVTLYQWLFRGSLKSRRSEKKRWIVWADEKEIERLLELRRIPRGHNTRKHWVPSDKIDVMSQTSLV